MATPYLEINSASGAEWGRVSEPIRYGRGLEPSIPLPRNAFNKNVKRGEAFIEFRLAATADKANDIRTMGYADISLELSNGTIVRGAGMRNLVCSPADGSTDLNGCWIYFVRFEGDEVECGQDLDG